MSLTRFGAGGGSSLSSDMMLDFRGSGGRDAGAGPGVGVGVPGWEATEP
jgi:hypothetical protein